MIELRALGADVDRLGLRRLQLCLGLGDVGRRRHTARVSVVRELE